MLRPHYFILFASLLIDAGTTAPQSSASEADGGTVALQPSTSGEDAGTGAPQPSTSEMDAGAEGIRWPEEVRPLATLDGPAVLAAHAAMHFVRINQRLDKCGPFAPGINLSLDWFELYAVSPDGKVLARYPYYP